MRAYCVLIVAFLLGAVGHSHNPVRLPAKVLRRGSNSCPSNQDMVDASGELRQKILQVLADSCGGTSWKRVGYLDMTDPSQSCPSGLDLKNYSPGSRSCGRATTDLGCWSTFYNTSGSQYSRVCGRVRGYQFGATSAFRSEGIDAHYVEGVSLTHASGTLGRTHIMDICGWSS